MLQQRKKWIVIKAKFKAKQKLQSRQRKLKALQKKHEKEAKKNEPVRVWPHPFIVIGILTYTEVDRF